MKPWRRWRGGRLRSGADGWLDARPRRLCGDPRNPRPGRFGRGARRFPIVALTAHVVGAQAQAWREAAWMRLCRNPSRSRNCRKTPDAPSAGGASAGGSRRAGNRVLQAATERRTGRSIRRFWRI